MEPIWISGQNLNNLPQFISENSLVQSTGPILFESALPENTRNQTFVAKDNIETFSVCSVTKRVAFAETGSKVIQVLEDKWESPKQFVIPEAEETIQILQLQFSVDGLYLAVLLDLPSYKVIILDTQQFPFPKISSSSDNEALSKIIFHPTRKSEFVGIKENGGLCLFDVIPGHQKWTIKKRNCTEPIWTFPAHQNLSNSSWASSLRHSKMNVKGVCWFDEETIICIQKGTGEVLLIGSNDAKTRITTVNGNQDAFKWQHGGAVLPTIDGMIMAGDDGILRWIEVGNNANLNIENEVEFPLKKPVLCIVPNNSYTHAAILTVCGILLWCDLVDKTLIEIRGGICGDLQSSTSLSYGEQIIIQKDNNTLVGINGNSGKRLFITSVDTQNDAISVITGDNHGHIFAVGTVNGHVTLFDSLKNGNIVARWNVADSKITALVWNSDGSRIAIGTAKDGLVIMDITRNDPVLAHEIEYNPRFKFSWVHGDLIYQRADNVWIRFQIVSGSESRHTLSIKGEYHVEGKSVEEWIVVPCEAPKAVLVTVNTDSSVKAYEIEEKTTIQILSGSKIRFDAGQSPRLHFFNLPGSFCTSSSDGQIFFHSVTNGHTFSSTLAVNGNSHILGIHPTLSTKSWTVVTDEGSIVGWIHSTETKDRGSEVFEKEMNSSWSLWSQHKNELVVPVAYNESELRGEPLVSAKALGFIENAVTKDVEGEELFRQVEQISAKLVKLMEKNIVSPNLEQLPKEDFLLDNERKKRLEQQADLNVQEVKKQIERQNARKGVLQKRLKDQFWHSMECTGRSLKSFLPNPINGKHTIINNFPIKKRPQHEVLLLEKIKLNRKVESYVRAATEEKIKSDSENIGVTKTIANLLPFTMEESDIAGLLYKPIELITSERRRSEIVLLQEVVRQAKIEFNKKFNEMFKGKTDEITKVEDKNGRIREILAELEIEEKLVTVALDDDEAPERILEIHDSEISAPNPELALKNQNTKRQDQVGEEEMSQRRALEVMMGGKLEDREETEKDDILIEPECAKKNKLELTEEDKKVLKEYEAKVLAKKQEFEKRRKALEAEMRKIQVLISEICSAYDQKLRTFLDNYLEVQLSICRIELHINYLAQVDLLCETDTQKELEIAQLLDILAANKSAIMNEIPGIKKELEKQKEEYEHYVKLDKDVERTFRKEFAIYDFFFEPLLKLFKRRDFEKNGNTKVVENSRNPFKDAKTAASNEEEEVIKPLQDDLCPEGLPIDAWNKFVELREKKLATEKEVRISFKVFSNLQEIVASILEASERIRLETEETMASLKGFFEYKFQSMFNRRNLFKLKQGQIEIPQQAVVVEYSDAILIDRSIVEQLNGFILDLGKSKVEALNEMKEYRKGIYGLEWENKIIDFQAEDVLLKIRDIQLLRVTKEMQEFLRNGEKHRATSELAALEKRSDHGIRATQKKMKELQLSLSKWEERVNEKKTENENLQKQITHLQSKTDDRIRIIEAQGAKGKDANLDNVLARRRLTQLSRSQTRDIEVLTKQLHTLREKNYPSLQPLK